MRAVWERPCCFNLMSSKHFFHVFLKIVNVFFRSHYHWQCLLWCLTTKATPVCLREQPESQVDCSQAAVNKTPTGPLRVPTGRAQLFVFSSGFLELLWLYFHKVNESPQMKAVVGWEYSSALCERVLFTGSAQSPNIKMQFSCMQLKR